MLQSGVRPCEGTTARERDLPGNKVFAQNHSSNKLFGVLHSILAAGEVKEKGSDPEQLHSAPGGDASQGAYSARLGFNLCPSSLCFTTGLWGRGVHWAGYKPSSYHPRPVRCHSQVSSVQKPCCPVQPPALSPGQPK